MEDLYNIVYSQKKATPTIPIRTKFKWILDENNYCVAIQMATGILQVKAADKGIVIADPDARETIYGMPYREWQAMHQKEASTQQLADFTKVNPSHLRPVR